MRKDTAQNTKQENFIIVDNAWFREDFRKNNPNTFTNDDLFLFALLQKNMLIRGNRLQFNMDWIYKQLKISNSNTHSQKKVKTILQKFGNEKVLNYNSGNISKVGKNGLIYAEVILPREGFTKIYDSEFDKIITCGESTQSLMGMFSVFCNLCSRIGENGYCYPSFDRLMVDCHISRESVIRYLMILQDKLKLIFYDNVGGIFENEKYKQDNNYYVINRNDNAVVELQEVLIQRKKELTSCNIPVVNNDKTNENIRISMEKKWIERNCGTTIGKKQKKGTSLHKISIEEESPNGPSTVPADIPISDVPAPVDVLVDDSIDEEEFKKLIEEVSKFVTVDSSFIAKLKGIKKSNPDNTYKIMSKIISDNSDNILYAISKGEQYKNSNVAKQNLVLKKIRDNIDVVRERRLAVDYSFKRFGSMSGGFIDTIENKSNDFTKSEFFEKVFAIIIIGEKSKERLRRMFERLHKGCSYKIMYEVIRDIEHILRGKEFLEEKDKQKYILNTLTASISPVMF